MVERRAILIRGTVQGVGFRPFVYNLASELQLAGFVRNSTGGVQIEVEGDPGRLDAFVTNLTRRPPPPARIETVSWEQRPVRGDSAFRIETSVCDPGAQISISPDVATCHQCLAELFDPADRRYRYPFLNCTNCGPRLTIITGAPYDRERTTMSSFHMCAHCRREYEDPSNRRFHAQPNACPACGPRLRACGADGRDLEIPDPLGWFVQVIRSGKIGAMKGLGGYHLVCDATNRQAVATLRTRKQRYEKPFAVMVRDMNAARHLCEVSAVEAELLTSPSRPITLLNLHRGGTRAFCDLVAPGNPSLGVMLPYTPLHHLLMNDSGGLPLVMTSGNRSDEPIAYAEPEAFERLAGIADAFLTHDRPIHVRCDDSVTRVINKAEAPIRRSRGYAPHPVRLPIDCAEPGLAVGGQLKGTFALGRDAQAVLSHHLGDLDDLASYRAFEKDVALYERLFGIHPRWIAHDLHPDYASTRYARQRAYLEHIRLIPVQHHHAHLASCMVEHGLTEPVIGVTFDGSGYGTDGAIWGGEFLVGDASEFRRAAHLRYVRMPGGEAAVREPWRMAVAHLADAVLECPSLRPRIDPVAFNAAGRMLQRGFNSPPTSSAGRLFDAVASLAGVRDFVSFEGQAAMQLESLATGLTPDHAYPVSVASPSDASPLQIDTRTIITAVVSDVAGGVTPELISRRFHTWLVSIITQMCMEIRRQTGLGAVVLSGGVLMNSLLAAEAEEELRLQGFSTFRHNKVPANDGGLSLGQVLVAASRARQVPSQLSEEDPCAWESRAR